MLKKVYPYFLERQALMIFDNPNTRKFLFISVFLLTFIFLLISKNMDKKNSYEPFQYFYHENYLNEIINNLVNNPLIKNNKQGQLFIDLGQLNQKIVYPIPTSFFLDYTFIIGIFYGINLDAFFLNKSIFHINYGLLRNNKLLLPIIYDKIALTYDYLGNSYAIIKLFNIYGFVFNWELMLTPQYDLIEKIADSYLLIKSGKKYGLFYRNIFVLKPVYEKIEKLNDGYFSYQLDGKAGLVKQNIIVTRPLYDKIYNRYLFSEGFHLVLNGVTLYYFWIVFYLSNLLFILFLLFFRLGFPLYLTSFRKRILELFIKLRFLIIFSLQLDLFFIWLLTIENSLNILIIIFLMFLFIGYYYIMEKKVKERLEHYFIEIEGVFPYKKVYFDKIYYNQDGAKKYFLIHSPQGNWLIINNKLETIPDYQFYSFLKMDKSGVFILRKNLKEYYVSISGEKPIIKLKI